MNEIETLDDLIGRGVVSFATIGRSILGQGQQRHASISIRGTSRFVQGYGNTSAEALGAALGAIDRATPPQPDAQHATQDDQDPLADMLG